MERPAGFADLGAWAVYGDWLQDRGDPRGELIALDLACQAVPDRDALAVFQARHRELCGERERISIAYALGQPRAFAVEPGESIMFSKGGKATPHEGTLANARDLLASEAFAQVDEVALAQPYEDNATHWRRLIAAIPASCRRVVLRCRTLATSVACELADRLPAGVRELVISRERGGYAPELDILPLMSDRFELVELVGFELSRGLRETIAGTRSLRLRLRRLEGALPPRVELGDAALFDRARSIALALPGWSLHELARRYGPMPIRTQLARTLPESYDVTWGSQITVGGTDLVRRGAAWTLRGREPDAPTVFVDHEPVATGAIVRLDHGSRLRFAADGDEWIFLARDATAEIRASA